MFGSRICYFSDTFCKLCNMQQASNAAIIFYRGNGDCSV